ncbi:HNH endonuclease signature motif containing protein [Streptomyces sp. NPDC001544]|uniref:HNH endonuclease signature motif containing protein n=1 Tax=Streptomyces sp. NPDC001544 TaxID=3364584 RepID=UPI0036D113B0
MKVTAEERFWSKVEKTATCWLWTAYKNANGYGRFNSGGRHGRIVFAHRWAYEQRFGAIPEGLALDHLCRVRHCVNPEHLEPVTSRTNTMRGETIAARHATKTHCDNGHEYTPENTRISTGGRRCCRACVREFNRARRARKAAAR